MMYQTSDNSQLCIDSQYSSQQLTIVWSLKHHSTQPIYTFNRENPQNSESPNGPRRGPDFIAFRKTTYKCNVMNKLIFKIQKDHSQIFEWPIWISNIVLTPIVWLSCCGTDSMLEFVWKGRNMGIGYPTGSVLLLLGNPAPCPIFWSFSTEQQALWSKINNPI